jgi:hypothetical protein
MSTETGGLVRFFNPRKDVWTDHFRLEGPEIVSVTEIGEATARILRFNDRDRIVEREALIEARLYPSREGLDLSVP